MPLHTALITLLTMMLLFIAAIAVGRARGKFAIHAPATTGNADFERVFRAQMNTQEATLIFLPTIWLAAQYSPCSPMIVAALGYIWVLGRLWYLLGYWQAAGKREGGFIVGFVTWLLLFVVALIGVGTQWLAV
jgi:uncharacterized MAPEG superfamily protein